MIDVECRLKAGTRIFMILFCIMVIPASSFAELLNYTFEGTINGFHSYHSELDINDFDISVGETQVKYVFEVDFDSNQSTYSNAAGTWNYFYSELLSGSVIEGIVLNSSYEGFNWDRTEGANVGQVTGSQLDVRIKARSSDTDNWRVQDWVVGQRFESIDSGTFPGSSYGSAVYAYGDVTLTSISPIPEPMTAAFIFSALTLFVVRRNVSFSTGKGTGNLYMHLNRLFSLTYLRAGSNFQDRWIS